MSRDIVEACLKTSSPGWQPLWLVIAGWVQGELAQQRPAGGEDADVEVGDQDDDLGSSVPSPDADVVELAAVAQGDGAAAVDGVLADPAVGGNGDLRPGGESFDPGGVGGGWCLAADGPVGPAGVVVGGEAVELGLQGVDGGYRPLAGEPFLQGLVEAFDLAAGLGVVGPGVAVGDAGGDQFALDDAGAVPGRGGEHGAVVGEHRGGWSVLVSGVAEDSDHVGGAVGRPGGGGDQEPGVIVDDVEDLGAGAAGQLPVSDVHLPSLVRQVSAKPRVRGPGAFLRLRRYQPAPAQHPPDRRHRRHQITAPSQVPGDRVRP